MHVCLLEQNTDLDLTVARARLEIHQLETTSTIDPKCHYMSAIHDEGLYANWL